MALAAALAASAALVGASATAHAGPGPAPDDPEQPLAVTLETLSPAVVPKRGPVQVTGSVTNESDETWTNVNLYAFSSRRPITTPEGLAAALEVEPGTAVGRRVVAADTFDSVDDLEPGETAGFTLRVPRNLLDIPADEPGVYWFGVHALGTNVDGRDSSADGRARTFLAELGPDSPQLPVSLVLPMRRPVVHAPDGSIDEVDGWVRDLESEGRLRALLDFAEAGSDASLTWLVDPAVLDAVDRLAAGNPERSIAPTRPATTGPSEGASPSDSSSSPSEGTTGTTGAPTGAPRAPRPTPTARSRRGAPATTGLRARAAVLPPARPTPGRNAARRRPPTCGRSGRAGCSPTAR